MTLFTFGETPMKRLFCLVAIAAIACPLAGCEEQKDTREIKIETPRSSTTIKTEIEKKDKD
jgi:hypothetical protein